MKTVPLLPGTDDENDRTTISSRSSSSTSTSAAQAAKLKRILSEKKIEKLRRAKARKIKEESSLNANAVPYVQTSVPSKNISLGIHVFLPVLLKVWCRD